MATDLGVGDAESPTLDVTPADGDTVATLTAKAPNGSVTTVPVSAGTLEPVAGTSPVEYTQRWTAVEPVTYTQPGRWVLAWTVTGTGEGAEDVEVWVVASPTAGGPSWTPGVSRVAAYVPHRTLARDLSTTRASEDQYQLTFDATTTPTGVMVSRLVADGVAWVSSRLSPVHPTSEAGAAVLAVIYAAAAVERGWPHDEYSLQRANDLEKRMDAMMKDLIAANNAAGGTGDFGIDIAPAPAWLFPPPDLRYDNARYW